eukprot:scaffold834_cov244-Pinguiococcus_pyrenoidosus.AAC.22
MNQKIFSPPTYSGSNSLAFPCGKEPRIKPRAKAARRGQRHEAAARAGEGEEAGLQQGARSDWEASHSSNLVSYIAITHAVQQARHNNPSVTKPGKEQGRAQGDWVSQYEYRIIPGTQEGQSAQ